MTARPLVTVDDLHVRIGGSHILQGVSFTVADRGVTALLGRNGVGKTTTVRALLGLVPRTGRVTMDGRDISGEATHVITRRGIGYVPEDRGVFSALTVAENLRLAERPGAEPRYGLVHELFPELAGRASQPAGTLSGGQQQMLAIGRVLLNDNRLIVVDEPTKGLAPRVVGEVAAALERAARTAPILLVEQNLPLVRRLAHDAAVLDAGRVVFTGTTADLLGDARRTREFLGVAKTTTTPGQVP
ncbi:branched-chain amino acid transport system ATP-binding protein [Spinactinospora alkalitolerans]|uniref:Branched-chain amino acid transport system ATP-binding protein n=1 Tax=Spinactinospora alkalitolerans TaxID=687207 RepID=A0A852TMT0_9ACTN|nr:ABC transporter ATP-binding protein [Spinactinospora alkalitolerans]NYE45616.1 branched-chain amino acid transport system ATP-binding protein [Spinactinospora alkalitolerans]